MATVVITVTDSPSGATLTCQSSNPPIPLAHDGSPITDELTAAQTVAIGAVMALCEMAGDNADFRTLLGRP